MQSADSNFQFSPLPVSKSSVNQQISDLWQEIWQTLMVYLDAEDESHQKKQKEDLTELMRQFVCRVPHSRKFYLASTGALLTAAARGRWRSFRPAAVAAAFDSLHQYAVRAICLPWRPEFSTINLYSGHYVHTVQSCMGECDGGGVGGAEAVLQEMGFLVKSDTATAQLAEPRDEDQLIRAAIDTLMAKAECQIVQRVMQSVCDSALGVRFSAHQVLAYRIHFVCDVSGAVRQLSAASQQDHFGRVLPSMAVEGEGGLQHPRSDHQHHKQSAQSSGSWQRSSQPPSSPLPVASRGVVTADLLGLGAEGGGGGVLLPATLDDFNIARHSGEAVSAPPPERHSPADVATRLEAMSINSPQFGLSSGSDPLSTPSVSAPTGSAPPCVSPATPGGATVASWACHACTFLNTAQCNICAICGKTRLLSPPSTDPQHCPPPCSPSGAGEVGVECRVCTLVNRPHVLTCAVCQTPLSS